MEGSVSPKSNRLYALLGDEAHRALSPHLEHTPFQAGAVLHEPGQSVKHVLFPASGLIARVALTMDGKATELGLCGSEGMVGLGILLVGRPLTSRAVAVCAGSGFRVPGTLVRALWRQSEAVQQVILSYVHLLVKEISQTALCNKHHTVEQQLCRWLLTAIDRHRSDTLHVTQSLIAHLLGVRREGITEAAGRLEAHGLIRRERGGMTLLDRSRMETRCCECYAVVKGDYARTLTEAARTFPANTAGPFRT